MARAIIRVNHRGPSNLNWVCWDCRKVVRRPSHLVESLVVCPQCRAACSCLGDTVALPPKDDDRAWKQLLADVNRSHRISADFLARHRAHRRHVFERRLAELESLGEGARDEPAIARLKAHIADLSPRVD